MVVGVGVHQADALPRAQLKPAFEYRDARVRRDEGRQDVVAAVAGGAVPVPPAVVPGEQPVQLREQVVVAARPVSMMASPAVACGTNTWRSPSASSRTKSAQSSVRSTTTGTPPVRTARSSDRMGDDDDIATLRVAPRPGARCRGRGAA